MRMVVIAVFVGLVLSFGAANATIPDPDFCTVDPCDDLLGVLVCPDLYEGVPAPPDFSEFTVNVRNGDNENIPGAFVEIVFGVQGNHVFCPSAVLTGTTDEFGNVTFNIAAGGCTIATDAVRIIANSVEIRSYENVKSPDYDGTSNGQVVLADFIIFGQAFSGINPEPCTDYDSTGGTILADFIIFGQGWAHMCE